MMFATELQGWADERGVQVHASLVKGQYAVTIADLHGEVTRAGLLFYPVLESAMEAWDRASKPNCSYTSTASRVLERVADQGVSWGEVDR
jgi:hypothetical protein